MKKSVPAENPDTYVAALTGWRRKCVEQLRSAVRAETSLEEVIKWGHLVYIANGPVLLIRAEDERVLLGFWRGKRLMEFESRLKPAGKYEMATVELRDGMSIPPSTVQQLVSQAVKLNDRLGNPTDVAGSA